MAVQYSGNIAHVQFDGSTKLKLITQMQTTLTSLGWTVVSGGGTTNLLMQTAVTPQNLQMRFRFKDNGGQCMTFSIENVGGTRVCPNDTTQGIHIYPHSNSQYRLIANPYQFMIWSPDDVTWGRRFGIGCVPWIPPFLQGTVYEAGFVQGACYSDSNGGAASSWRRYLGIGWTTGGCSNYQAIINNQYNYRANEAGQYTTSSGVVDWIVQTPMALNMAGNGGFRWINDTLNVSDIFVAWGLTAAGDEPKAVGQPWDVMVVHEAFQTMDMPAHFDDHNWVAVTWNNVGGNYCARGTVFAAIN